MNANQEKVNPLLTEGSVAQAVQFLKTLSPVEAFTCLYSLDYIKIPLLSPLVIALIINDIPDREWIDIGFAVGKNAVNYFPGAYEFSAYYARLYPIQDQPNEESLSCLLLLTSCPDCTLDPCEAVDIAQEALKFNSNKRLALETLRIFTQDGAICEHACMLKEQPDKALAFEWLIYQGKFPAAEAMMPMLGEKGWQAQLLFLGVEQRNLGAYAFVLYLISKEERAALHYLAYRMITLGYPRGIYGSNIVGYYHITRAHELEPDSLTYMEHIFLLYQESDETKRLIGKDRVTAIAQKLSSRGWSFVANSLIKRDKVTGSVTW